MIKLNKRHIGLQWFCPQENFGTALISALTENSCYALCKEYLNSFLFLFFFFPLFPPNSSRRVSIITRGAAVSLKQLKQMRWAKPGSAPQRSGASRSPGDPKPGGVGAALSTLCPPSRAGADPCWLLVPLLGPAAMCCFSHLFFPIGAPRRSWERTITVGFSFEILFARSSLERVCSELLLSAESPLGRQGQLWLQTSAPQMDARQLHLKANIISRPCY